MDNSPSFLLPLAPSIYCADGYGNPQDMTADEYSSIKNLIRSTYPNLLMGLGKRFILKSSGSLAIIYDSYKDDNYNSHYGYNNRKWRGMEDFRLAEQQLFELMHACNSDLVIGKNITVKVLYTDGPPKTYFPNKRPPGPFNTTYLTSMTANLVDDTRWIYGTTYIIKEKVIYQTPEQNQIKAEAVSRTLPPNPPTAPPTFPAPPYMAIIHG